MSNAAEAAAGALFATQYASVMLLSRSVCSNNTATAGLGGCMRLHQYATAIVDRSSLIADNNASRGGGVFLADRAALWVHGAIMRNKAVLPGERNYGGGVLASGKARVWLGRGSHVDANSAALYGGGVALDGSADAAFTAGSSCSRNTALEGGCVAATSNATVLIEGSVAGNEAILGVVLLLLATQLYTCMDAC
jgi:hypothetical protein